ncbi:MAG: class I SAM-dependent methyltransferase [Deltaproteobacteria bacterium]|nr:class I SAM-dependent methyltransferase [Deltaproteobacteria bacterium]
MCSSSDISDIFSLDKRISDKSFQIKRCNKCRIAWTCPIPDKEQLSCYYPDEYHGKGGQERFNPLMEFFVNLSRRKRASIVTAFTEGKSGKILDIGCGRGVMLNILKKMGWQVCGTELSKKSSSFARERHEIEVITKDISHCDFPEKSFDIVTMWHVLEHLPAPFSTIEEVGRILKDGGRLIVEVPNFGGLQATFFANKWFHLDSPRHIFHFNEKSLVKYIEKCGFQVIKRENLSWEYDPFGFIQSFLNIVSINFDSFYNFLRSGPGKMPGGGSWSYMVDVFIAIVLFPLLFPLSLLASLFSSLFKRGGIIRLFCIKKENM